METQFHGYGDIGHGGSGGSRFAQEIQQAMGEDFELDPQFLEESWTLGVAAATESWQRRQRNQVEREQQSRAFREMDSLGGLNFVPATDWVAAGGGAWSGTWSGSMAAMMDPDRSQQHAAAPAAAATEWPFGQPEQERWEDWDSDSDEPMTPLRACRLLGVDASSTREQIRAAYRRLASQWHPDRRAGQGANQRMAAINEAYRVLR
jgi:hypothetical protein